MPNSYASIDLLVITHENGELEVFAPGQLPVGAIIANPRKLNISSPGMISTPRGRQSAAQFDSWVENLKKTGFAIIYQ